MPNVIFALMKVLMVCLGNICRSPLAEGILRHKVEKAGLDWEVDSAGTSHYETGYPPHTLSQKLARSNGLDISKQQCRQFTEKDMQTFDKIFVMDDQNYKNIKRLSGPNWDENKVDFLMNELHPNQNMSIPDPYFGVEADYKKVYQMIDDACEVLIRKHSNQ